MEEYNIDEVFTGRMENEINDIRAAAYRETLNKIFPSLPKVTTTRTHVEWMMPIQSKQDLDDPNFVMGSYIPLHSDPDPNSLPDLQMVSHKFNPRPMKLNVKWSNFYQDGDWCDDFAESEGYSDFNEMTEFRRKEDLVRKINS